MAEPAPRNIALPVLLLTACIVVILVIVVFRPLTAPRNGDPSPTADGPLAQSDTVSPGTKFTGQVFYPIPYSSPPNLKLQSDDRKRVYEIVKQDEFGFVWLIYPCVDDIAEATAKAASKPEDLFRFDFSKFDASNFKPNLHFSDFKYEANGLRGTGKSHHPFEQTGTFTTMSGTEGEVVFPIAYAGPANVELTGNPANYVVITECKATGFRWKNSAERSRTSWGDGSVKWTARGIRDK